MVSREGPVLSTAERTRLIRRVIDEAIGLGVLEPLLADPSVTEIMVNGPDEVFLEREGRLERADITFTDEAQLYQTIDRIVSQVNRRVDESSPMVDARLPTGERVNVIIPPLALRGPTMTIRRFPRLFTLDQLVEMRSLDAPTAQLLRACVAGRLNVVISGGTGAGKTTLLNAMSAAVPPGERIITVEDNAELRLQQPHVVTLEARPANVEGKGEVSIRDLVRNSLRMRPDRIIVGEVRGGETLDMLQALNTGHEGSLVTVHANSPDDAIHRLETLATMSDLHIPFEALRDQINSAIHLIVQIDRYADGRRRIAEVALVASTRRETFRLGTVAQFESDAVGPDRKVTGRFRHFPLPPAIARRLMLMGHEVPDEFGPEAEAPATPEREAELMAEGRARARRAAGGDGPRHDRRPRCTSAAPTAAPRSPPAAASEGGGSALRALLERLDQRLRGDLERPAARAVAALLRRPPDADRLRRDRGRRAASSPACVLTLLTPPIVAFVLGYVFVVAGLRWWVERQRAKRRDAFMDQLPDLARMLSNGTQAGLSIAGAVQMSARELDDPAAAEMAAVVQEMRLGQPLDVALERLQKRLPSREVAVLMSTIIIQQRAGGDTVRALQELGGTLEARKDLIREIRTVLSGSVFTSYIVAGIGIVAIVLMNVLTPGVMREMTSSPAGLLALGVAGVLWTVAFVLIRATTKVDV